MRTAHTVRNIMWQCFFIWAATNAIGLIWVTVGIPGLGILGPAGAAAYNFLTDFIVLPTRITTEVVSTADISAPTRIAPRTTK